MAGLIFLFCFFFFPFARAAWLVRRSFIWTCRGSIIIVISSIWCFFFLCRLLFLSSTQIRCGAVCQERKGHWKNLKQNKTTIWIWHLLQAASFFFFALLVYKQKKSSRNTKKNKQTTWARHACTTRTNRHCYSSLTSVLHTCVIFFIASQRDSPKKSLLEFFFFPSFPV